MLGATSRIYGGWGCQVLRSQTPSLFYHPAHVPREQESQISSSSVLYKKIFYPRVLVVSSVCCVFALFFFFLQNIQNCLACPSVCVLVFVCLCLPFSFVFFVSKRHLLESCSSLPTSSPGSSGAVVIGNVLSGRQSCVAPRPSCCSPTTPSTLHRVSLSRLPLRGVSPPEGTPVLSEPLDVPVFLAENGDLVLKQDGVQSHLGVDQWHGAKPAGELVHAGLPLGKVVRIGPARSPRRLGEKTRTTLESDYRRY